MATKRKSDRSSSALVDAQLERYRSMRDFTITEEPSGQQQKKAAKKSAKKAPAKSAASQPKAKAGKGTSLPFVIQKHAATRLHYDFRLGWNGVLKSWAVTKGPSYVTKDKRLAVQVEDHPIEYGGFEGIIPKGQYGGGTVMLWDTGTWEPQPEFPDVDAGLRDGSLKFILHGEKMKGKWALIRMGGKAAQEGKPNWLLIKEHDDYERGPDDPAITDEEPDSVVTHRTMDEIAQQEDHVWNSKGAADQQTKVTKPAASKDSRAAPKKPKVSATAAIQLPAKAAKEKLPSFIPPQLATQADEPPTQNTWLHELKLDGYRIQARLDQSNKDGGKVQLLTRTGLDWTHRMKSVAEAVAQLPAKTALLDGEVVVLDADGLTSFANLQAAFKDGARHPFTCFVFDLLHLNGHNLRPLPLEQRKAALADLLAGNSDETLRFSEHLDADGARVFQKACSLHAEGILSKLASAPYTSGRTRTWLKVKCALQQEFIIGGFTLPSNGMHGVGALLLGYYDTRGKLVYAGRTGTGFTQKTHALLRTQLDKLHVEKPLFASLPAGASKGVRWVTPKLVADVHFATWTADNLVRQAAFQGLREDKPAKDVRREEAVHLSRADVRPAARAAHQPRASHAAKAVRKSESSKPESNTRQKSAVKEEDNAHAPVRLTHPDKILDTESKLTKQQLADYYWSIAEHLLPHIINRPISLVRCPEGSTSPCFFQKHVTPTLPPGIETVMIRDKTSSKPEPYITLSTREALAGLAQMGVLEIHPWGSTNDNLEHPDHIIFDLDPDTAIDWPTLAASAKELRALLKNLGLESFLKSTGGKGLHVVAPIQPEHEWPAVKEFAHNVALYLERQHPERYLSKMSKAARANKIFIDYLRNERGSTAVAPFSPRARAGAPVSVPLSWTELDDAERPSFGVTDSAAWQSRLKRDPWKKLPSLKQSLDLKKAAAILGKAAK